jgi:hypothetical protein
MNRGDNMKFKAVSTRQYADQPQGPEYQFSAKNYQDARNWIINHCDTSYSWTVFEIE